LHERGAAVNECFWGREPSVGYASLAAAWTDDAPFALCALDEAEAERVLNLESFDEAAEEALDQVSILSPKDPRCSTAPEDGKQTATALRAWQGRQLVLRAVQHCERGAEVALDPAALIGLAVDELAALEWLASKIPFALEGLEYIGGAQTIRTDTLTVDIDNNHRILSITNEGD
jgi:hypothetical protein